MACFLKNYFVVAYKQESCERKKMLHTLKKQQKKTKERVFFVDIYFVEKVFSSNKLDASLVFMKREILSLLLSLSLCLSVELSIAPRLL